MVAADGHSEIVALPVGKSTVGIMVEHRMMLLM